MKLLTLFEAIIAIKQISISHFCAPCAIQGDDAIQEDEFIAYLRSIDSTFRLPPRYRNNKNTKESKHSVICDVFIRHCADISGTNSKVLACQSVQISSDLYENDVASAQKLVKGYTNPRVGQFPLSHLMKILLKMIVLLPCTSSTKS